MITFSFQKNQVGAHHHPILPMNSHIKCYGRCNAATLVPLNVQRDSCSFAGLLSLRLLVLCQKKNVFSGFAHVVDLDLNALSLFYFFLESRFLNFDQDIED